MLDSVEHCGGCQWYLGEHYRQLPPLPGKRMCFFIKVFRFFFLGGGGVFSFGFVDEGILLWLSSLRSLTPVLLFYCPTILLEFTLTTKCGKVQTVAQNKKSLKFVTKLIK